MHDDEPQRLTRLRSDFGDWLGGPSFTWTHFVHAGFSKTPGRKAIEHGCTFFSDLAGDLERDSFVAFVAMEVGPEGGRHHLHSLVEAPGVSGPFIKSEWERQYGFAKVRTYNPKLGGLHYVTKYVLKDACGSADWRLLPTFTDGPNQDLFVAACRLTGYQLYTRQMEEFEQMRSESL